MESNLYKTIFLVMLVSVISLFEGALYAGPLSLDDDTASNPRLESPDFDMDQSGDNTKESDGAERWENEGTGSLSAATESSHDLALEKETKPPTLKFEEAQASDLRKAKEEKSKSADEKNAPKEDESEEEEDSLLETE